MKFTHDLCSVYISHINSCNDSPATSEIRHVIVTLILLKFTELLLQFYAVVIRELNWFSLWNKWIHMWRKKIFHSLEHWNILCFTSWWLLKNTKWKIIVHIHSLWNVLFVLIAHFHIVLNISLSINTSSWMRASNLEFASLINEITVTNNAHIFLFATFIIVVLVLTHWERIDVSFYVN